MANCPATPAGATLNAQLLADVDRAICATINTAANGVAAHVIPIIWIFFSISLLIWSTMMMLGKSSQPMCEGVGKFATVFFVVIAAGTLYVPWVVQPILRLGNDLSAAIIGTSSSVILDSIDLKITSIVRSCFATIANLPKALGVIPDMNGMLILALMAIFFMLSGAVLEIVAVVNLIYARFGLGLVLIVGPFFIGVFLVQAVRNWFFSWLNTCLYFVMLTVLTVAYIALCTNLADIQLASVLNIVSDGNAKLQGATQAQVFVITNEKILIPLLVKSFNFLVMALILGVLGAELRTIASSITGGSGGSAGQGLMSIGRATANQSYRSSMLNKNTDKGK